MKATTARSITSAAQDAATTSPPPRPASLRNTLAADAVGRYQPAWAAVPPAPCTGTGTPESSARPEGPVLAADTGGRGNRPHGTGTSVTSLHGLMDLPPTGTGREAAERSERWQRGEELVVMMFGYGNGWPVWEGTLMWIGVLAFLGVLIWAGYALISSTTQIGRAHV